MSLLAAQYSWSWPAAREVEQRVYPAHLVILVSCQETREAFYRDVAGLGQEAVASKVEELLHKEVTEESYYQQGEFLPLGVWQTRGFDAAQIEANSHPSDKMTHPVLGPTYRVRVVATRHSTTRRTERVSKSTVGGRKRAADVMVQGCQFGEDGGSASTNQVLALEDGSIRSSSPSSTSSSSSSSSSSRKKHKKSKKAKKTKKHKKEKKHKKDSRGQDCSCQSFNAVLRHSRNCNLAAGVSSSCA